MKVIAGSTGPSVILNQIYIKSGIVVKKMHIYLAVGGLAATNI